MFQALKARDNTPFNFKCNSVFLFCLSIFLLEDYQLLFYVFWWNTQINLEYPIQNMIHQVIQINHSMFRARFNDLGFIFDDSGSNFHKPYFSWKHIFLESYRVKRMQDYDLKNFKQVLKYLAMS